jgi:hypothetical protein
MNKNLGSSTIYLIEEQYCLVKNPKSFDIQYLRLIVMSHIDSIFVQVWIMWFRNREQVCFECCKLWSSSAFRAVSEKKRLCHEKELKHRYGTDGHVCKSKHMIRAGVVLSAIYML